MPEQGLTNFKGIDICVISGSGLKDVETIGKMDPYLKVDVGTTTLQTEPMNNAGSDPEFNSRFLMPYKQEKSISIAVFDKKSVGKDKIACSTTLDMSVFDKRKDLKTDLPMKDKKNKPAGTLSVLITMKEAAPASPQLTTYAEAGNSGGPSKDVADASSHGLSQVACDFPFKGVKVVLVRGEQVYNPEMMGKMDPYVMCRLGNNELETEVFKDAGRDCNFNTTFVFPFNGEKRMRFQVWDREKVGGNKFSSECKIDLEPLLTTPGSQWTKCLLTTAKGKEEGKLVYRVQWLTDPTNGTDCRTANTEDLTEVSMLTAIAAAEAKGISEKDFGRSLSAEVGSETTNGETKVAIDSDTKLASVRVTVFQVNGLPETFSDTLVAVRVGGTTLKTERATDQGTTPKFENVLCFDYKNEARIKLMCFEEGKEIGGNKVDIGSFAQSGRNVFEGSCSVRKTDDKDQILGKFYFRVELRTKKDASGVYNIDDF